jgi:hypothetical protein
MKRFPLAALAASFASCASFAQQQVVRPPIAVYWISAATASGMGMGGSTSSADAMRMALGGRASSTRSMLLQLGSSQQSADPRGAHEIPPALGMGAALLLLSPQQQQRQQQPEPRESGELPQGVEQPRGRMLIFWGCSEKAGAGQPVIIDFAKVAAGQRVPGLASRAVARPQGPAPGRSRSYGEWPNREDGKPVPAEGSLRGDHAVKANYSPEIRFAVGERHDFLAPVQLSVAPAGDARRLSWARVPNATGYFIAAFGSKEGSNDMVMWTSSALQESGGALLDYVPPGEVARLIRETVVLAPERSDCAISAEAIKAMDVPFAQFIAYGDELNLVHPPRPQDPKVAWEQQWALKLRLKSTAALPLMEGSGEERAAPAERTRPERSSERATERAAQPAPAPQPQPQNPVEQGVEGVRGVLRGIFGR